MLWDVFHYIISFVFSVRVDDDFIISNIALEMMKKMSYMSGLDLGKNLQGPPKF